MKLYKRFDGIPEEKRPETISSGAAQAEPEVVKVDPWKMEDLKKAAPACRLMFDLDADCFRYKTADGKKRQVFDNVQYTADGDAAKVSYGYTCFGPQGKSGYHGKITLKAGHECYNVAAVAAGYLNGGAVIWQAAGTINAAAVTVEADAEYIKYSARPEASRKKEAKETIELAARTADQVACILRIIASRDGVPNFLEAVAEDLEKVAAAANTSGQAVTAGKHCGAVAEWIREVVDLAKETYKEQIEAAREAAAQTEPEAVEERSETISNSETAQEPEAARANEKKGENTMKKYAAYYEDFPSIPRILSAQNKREAEKDARRYRRAWKLPALIRVDCLTDEEAARLESTVNEFFSAGMEALDGLKEKSEASPLPIPAQAEPEAVAVVAEPEAQEEERADGCKPARGPVKPKDFAAEALTGRGWCIVFDSGMNRTRVIVQDGIREAVAPMIEEAGFWWSENMKSYNRKLTHKAHRAAVALAEKLRDAC